MPKNIKDLFDSLNLSSMESILGIKAVNKDKVIYTPASINIDYMFIKNKFDFGAGFKYMLFIKYNPKFYGRATYSLSDKLWTSATVSYGGFGGVDYELAIGGIFLKKNLVNVNIHYLEYLIAPTITSGQGFDFVFSRFF